MTFNPRSARGFTLLELLVAMVLLGLLSSLLFGGLRLGSRVWAEGERHLVTLEQAQTARNALRRILSRAVPRRSNDPRNNALLFDGESERLDFLGLSPAESIPGALFWMRLAVDRRADGNRLILGWRAMQPNEPPPERYADDETVVLLAGFTDVEFTYFGLPRGSRRRGAQWYGDWRNQVSLPDLIRVTVRFAADDPRPWADLVVAPAIREWLTGQRPSAGVRSLAGAGAPGPPAGAGAPLS